MKTTREIGDFGEELASSYLEREDYTILHRNYYQRGLGEIDIIASKENELSFIEIKFNRTKSFGDSLYRVTTNKQKRIYQTAEFYLSTIDEVYDTYSFDVIAINKLGEHYDIKFIQNAFWG